MSDLSEELLVERMCPYLKKAEQRASGTMAFLSKLMSEMEEGYPAIQKILHYENTSDEAKVTMTVKEGTTSYVIRNFSRMNNRRAGGILARYIFRRATTGA
ncbi:uncharacterized protein LOC134253615 [Saccostrea cucullata]|uniref:uncharacterized protein LOC134253615 n=1 Tax=Saccostrea cuccullata TaxID=36930 RepID=UPI002ED3D11E